MSDELTGCGDDQTFASVSTEALRAAAGGLRMTELERRCVERADHAADALVSERDRLAIVRAVLAEAGVAEMREARDLAYGLLWLVIMDTTTLYGRCTKEARAALLTTMTKEDQANGIEAARAALAKAKP